MARTSDETRRSSPAYFFVKIYSVAGNTFLESVRQPAFAVIVGVAVALIVISPYITMFTLLHSVKLIADMGLATVLLAGLLLAAFSASNVISQEIENRTVLTVISKPVGRTEFILGKFLGVIAGIVVGVYLLSVALVLTIAGGALEGQAATQELSIAHAVAIFTSLFLAVCYGVYSNFFNDRPFPSRAVGAAIPLFTLCFVVFGFVDLHVPPEKYGPLGKWGPFGTGVDFQMIYACVMLLWAVLILAAVAVAASTRLAPVVNVGLCSGVFLLALLSDYLFRNYQEGSLVAKALYRVIPNLQVFWIADLLSADVTVPFSHVLKAGVYALCQLGAFLFLAMALFQERQVA